MNKPTLIVACTMLAGSVFEGCTSLNRIERSRPLTRVVVASLVDKEAAVELNDDSMVEATILAVNRDSLLLRSEHSRRYVHFDSVRVIHVKGAWWGQYAGGLIGAGIGGGVGALIGNRSTGWGGNQSQMGAYDGAFLGLLVGGLAGKFFFTPDWSYRAPTKEPPVEPDSLAPPAPPLEQQSAVYVLEVEKLLEETETFVVIPWQGKRVQLEKTAITIEKLEKTYRLTVPARLLPPGTK